MTKWVLGLALAGLVASAGARAESFLGFRLLDLDGVLVRWGNSQDGKPVQVTYAILSEPARFEGARNCAAMRPPTELLSRSRIESARFKAEVRAAFDMWEAVANIEFRETTDLASAGIVLGAQENPEGRAFANVAYQQGKGAVRAIERSLVCLNPKKPWKIGFDGNLDVYDLRYTLAHEIGHAIGLDHPEPGSQLMSFRYGERFRELQPGDIGGAIKIYGMRLRQVVDIGRAP